MSLLLLAGQTALIAHHHEPRPSDGGRPTVTRQDETGSDAACGLCSLATQSRASHVAAAPPALSKPAAEETAPLPPLQFAGRVGALRASSRAPPAA